MRSPGNSQLPSARLAKPSGIQHSKAVAFIAIIIIIYIQSSFHISISRLDRGL